MPVLRFIVLAIIILLFLRRVVNLKNAGGVPRTPPQTPRPPQGRKNDFRDIPPPPENPELG
jgi:hypothetical protein